MKTEYLIGDCVTRAQSISLIAERLSNEEFPGNEPRELALCIKNLAWLFIQHIVEFINSDSYDPERDADYLRAIDYRVKLISEPLRYVDGASSDKVPWSLIDPFQEFARKIAPDVVLILRPMWSFNYTILLEDLTEWLYDTAKYIFTDKEIQKALNNLDQNLHIISFPFTDRKSVLLHSILAHEIGHIIIKEFLDSEISTIPEDIDSKIKSQVQKEVEDGTVLELFASNETSEKLKQVSEYRKRAIEEIGSDIVGIYMLGPAALFAYYSLALGEEADSTPCPENNRYPPWRYRIYHSLEVLKSIGLVDWETLEKNSERKWLEYLKVYKENIDDIELFTSTCKRPKDDFIIEIAYDWFERSLEEIKEYIIQRCKSKSMVGEPAIFWENICSLANKRLENDLPPNIVDDVNGYIKPSPIEAILNSAWLFRLAKIPCFPNSTDDIEDYQNVRNKLDRLTLRALEISYLQRIYDTWG